MVEDLKVCVATDFSTRSLHYDDLQGQCVDSTEPAAVLEAEGRRAARGEAGARTLEAKGKPNASLARLTKLFAPFGGVQTEIPPHLIDQAFAVARAPFQPHKEVGKGLAATFPAACSDDAVSLGPKDPVVPEIPEPPSDFPEVVEGGGEGGFQVSVEKLLENFCEADYAPRDLDATGISERPLLATCGSLPGGAHNALAFVDPETGAVSELALPSALAGSEVPIFATTSTVYKPNGATKLYVGFTQEYSPQTLENFYLVSGVHTVDPETGGVYSEVFLQVDASHADGSTNVGDTAGSGVGVFTPNWPVTTLVFKGEEGEPTVALTPTKNPRGASAASVTYGPGTVQISVFSGDTLVSAGDQVTGIISENAIRLPYSRYDNEGNYQNPDADLAENQKSSTVLVGTHHIVSAGKLDNNTALLVSAHEQNITHLSKGGEILGTIPLNFDPAEQGQFLVLNKFQGKEGKFALLGTADGSGRIAVVDVAEPDDPFRDRERFYTIFGPEKVAEDGLTLSEDGKTLTVTSETGATKEITAPGGAEITYYDVKGEGFEVAIDWEDTDGTVRSQSFFPFGAGDISSISLSLDGQYAYVLSASGDRRTVTLADGQVSNILSMGTSGGPCQTLATGLACFTGADVTYSAFSE